MKVCSIHTFNTLRPRQNGRPISRRHFQMHFLEWNVWILIKISLKFIPKHPINNIPALVQIMAWYQPLSEPIMFSLPTHICINRPQWDKQIFNIQKWHWNEYCERMVQLHQELVTLNDLQSQYLVHTIKYSIQNTQLKAKNIHIRSPST